MLNGGLGNDILIGGVGKDAFLFNTALNAISNTDVIKDFQSGSDVLKLEYSVYTGLTFDAQSGALSSTSFVQASTAKTSDQHIIYDQANGALYYDQDGSGTVLCSNSICFCYAKYTNCAFGYFCHLMVRSCLLRVM